MFILKPNAGQTKLYVTSTLARVGSSIIVLLTCQALSGQTQSQPKLWLDVPKPASWNKPGAAVPAAPKLQESADPRCRELTRPAQSAEDKQVRAHGWDLVGGYQGGWQIVVIGGTAGYDGMCRPRQYQQFVFVQGAFAGTLAPQPMDSRTDGAISRVFLQNARQLMVEYQRYAATDPLCCPSGTTAVNFDIDAGVVRPVSASKQ